MRKAILTAGFLGLICIVCSVSAQRSTGRHTATTTKDTGTAKKLPQLPIVPVYLGNTGMTGGIIRKTLFDSAAKQGLTLSGSETGGAIKSFTFTYAERGLFEDSVGNQIISTDYLSEICDGPLLSTGVQSSIYERTKAGDTAYFNDIRVRLPSGLSARGATMKFLIAR